MTRNERQRQLEYAYDSALRLLVKAGNDMQTLRAAKIKAHEELNDYKYETLRLGDHLTNKLDHK